MSWLSRVVNVFRAERVTDELDEELQFHVDSRARDLMTHGMTSEDAYREARRRLGNAGAIRERSRDVKLVARLDDLVRDLRFAIRMLRRDGVVSLAAIASLALAIGGCTVAFALVDALILRPLPVRDPATLISIAVLEGGDRERTSLNYPLFAGFVEAVRGRAELAAFSYQSPSLATFDAGGGEERVYGQFVSGNGFGMLGVTPALGRVIVPSDDNLAGGRAVAVLSHSFWSRRFGRDPHVIGRVFTLERTTYQIVGVAREGFTGVEPGISTSLWMPLTSTPERMSLTDPGWHWFKVMGRLSPGHRADEVRGTMQAVLTSSRRERVRMSGDAPRAERESFLGARLVVRSASNGMSGLRVDYERPLGVLAAVVILVLLAACSNLANLMLARGAAREREMALRLSIGAGRGRLVQQMLVEAAAVAIAAAAVGAGFARVAAPAIVGLLAPSETPAYLDVRFDIRALAFAMGVAALATIAFGLIPAVRASGTSPIEALKSSSGRHTARARLLRPLVATQLAFSLTVLFLATLLLASFARLARVDTGFVADGVTLVSAALVHPADEQRAQDAALMLVDQVQSLPGVTSAGMSRWPLFSGAGWDSKVLVNGRRPNDADVWFLEVSPGFIETMRIRLLAGRHLTRRDYAPGSPSVLVNETFARLFLPKIPPLAGQFTRPERTTEHEPVRQIPHQVVGLVGDAKYTDLRETAPPTVYVPLRVRPGESDYGGTLAIRSTLPDGTLTEAVRGAAARLTPAMKVTGVTRQSTLVTNTMLRERLLALLSGFFALVSLTLAAVGLYGVLSYSVVQQTREIGIRMALGAARRTVVQEVVGGVAAYVALGMAAGVAGGIWLSRLVSTLLYEVRPNDLATIAWPVVMLLVVATVAAVLPARRAAGIDPAVTLRDE
jgi:putative ABC transport system permease protein